MSKIKLLVTITSFETTTSYEVPAIKNDHSIIYKDKDQTTTSYNFKKHSFTRDNKELTLKYVFKKNKKTKGKIYLKEYAKNIDLDIYTTEIITQENYYQIIYKLDNEEFIYKLEVID